MQSFQPEKIHRVILKLSGEYLAGEKGYGFDEDIIDRLTDDIIEVRKLGYGIGVVLGGGNIFRGGTWKNREMDRTVLDNIGMLATMQNALYLAEILNKKNYTAEVFSAIQTDKVAKFYSPARAETSIQEGRITFLCGGTGNPFFTTDTAAILRAIELNADMVLKGTKVDGVYSADPAKDLTAEFIADICFDEVIQRELRVMDMTAFSLAKENSMPIKIFNVAKPGCIREAITMPEIGTFVHA